MLDKNLIENYKRFKEMGGGIVGERSLWALKDARTLKEWEMLEADGLVRIKALPEEDSYFDVYGEPEDDKQRAQIIDTIERWGCWYVSTEYKDARTGEWAHADSIGFCIYSDPLSPFDNDYVPELMRGAIHRLHESELDEREDFFLRIQELDGHGLIITDDELLRDYLELPAIEEDETENR